MYSTSHFRNGLKILIDEVPFEIVYFQHVKPGKGGAFVRTKIKNLHHTIWYAIISYGENN